MSDEDFDSGREHWPVEPAPNGGRAPLVVRAGIPQIYGALVDAAAAARLPALFSANAFSVVDPSSKGFKGFRLSALSRWPSDWDVALDSAGFTAMARYGDYRWTHEQYLDLVAARDWTWWAAMDYCVEPPVAGAPVTKELRIQATAWGYHRSCELAARRGLKPPMPVLQGWLPQDYVHCVELMGLRGEQWPNLVGIGSVCRRSVYGPDGVATVIETLDRLLPPHVKFHLFGVKGTAVQRLGAHPRFASIDSQAWDYSLRAEQRTGRTQQMRVGAMLGWHARQNAIEPDLYEPAAGDSQMTFGDLWVLDDVPTVEAVVHKAVADWYCDWLLGEHGYREVAWMALQQAQLAVLTLEHHGAAALAETGLMPDLAALQALEEAGLLEGQREVDPGLRQRG